MIRNRLAELLAERGLKITQVAKDIPGLSRNTITATAQNDGKMIQLETIDLLCNYLGITPSEFFEFAPYRITVKQEDGEPDKIRVDVRDGRRDKTFLYSCQLTNYPREDSSFNYDYYAYLDSDNKADPLKEIVQGLPVAFQTMIEQDFVLTLDKYLYSDKAKVLLGEDGSEVKFAPDFKRTKKNDDASLVVVLPWADVATNIEAMLF